MRETDRHAGYPGFTAEDLSEIRNDLSGLTEKRRNHILAVERMAVRIGEIYLPGEENRLLLSAAALLHDITKEYTADEHFEVLKSHGIEPLDVERANHKTLHELSAALLIPEKYPKFALPEVISAVRKHTTGSGDMSVFDMIIYISDYIDDTRVFPECIALRNMFWDADPARMDEAEKAAHIRRVMLEALNVTLKDLIENGKTVHPMTVEARNSLILGK